MTITQGIVSLVAALSVPLIVAICGFSFGRSPGK